MGSGAVHSRLIGSITRRMYYVYSSAAVRVASWQPHMKNYNTNLGFDYGGRMQAAWIDQG